MTGMFRGFDLDVDAAERMGPIVRDRDIDTLRDRLGDKGYTMIHSVDLVCGLPRHVLVGPLTSNLEGDFYMTAQQLHMPYMPDGVYKD